jgi:hypothetical protein
MKTVKTNLRSKHICPISGSEWTFEDHRKIFNANIQGSNCYSYALNHPEPNGHRPNKSVPGDITSMHSLKRKSFRNTDWQSCGNAIERILEDGKTVAEKFGVKKHPNVIVKCKGTVKQQLESTPDIGWRKFVLVVDSNDEPDGTPTDFHFYAQNKILIDKIYNIKRIIHVPSNVKLINNPYNVLNVNAFCSFEHIKRSFRNLSRNNRMGTVSKDMELAFQMLSKNRAIANIMLHVDMLPAYAYDFIIDPWWILDVNENKHSVNTISSVINKKANELIKKINNGMNVNNDFKNIYKKVVNTAKNDCLKLVIAQGNEITMISKKTVIGLWSHKLGWGTEPLNTDGNGKLILDPSKCSRKHSLNGYDYDTTCQSFFILSGFGHSSGRK